MRRRLVLAAALGGGAWLAGPAAAQVMPNQVGELPNRLGGVPYEHGRVPRRLTRREELELDLRRERLRAEDRGVLYPRYGVLEEPLGPAPGGLSPGIAGDDDDGDSDDAGGGGP